MEYINKIELRGRVGRSDVQDYGSSRLCKFSLAIDYSYRDRAGNPCIDTMWFNISLWDSKDAMDFSEITKGAIVQLTKSMAAEYGRYKVRVNCIAPAAIMTPMMRQSNPENSTFDEERFLKLRTPLRRYGTPEEIAKVALFLASDESSYLNGAIIVADGGITINGDLSKC